MSEWHRALDAKELPEGTMKGVELAGTKLVLLHGTSGIRAFDDRCGHMSAPLSIATFKSGVLKCALHSAVFDAETGAVRGQPQYHREGMEKLPPEAVQALRRVAEIQDQIRCEPLHPFPISVVNGQVSVYV